MCVLLCCTADINTVVSTLGGGIWWSGNRRTTADWLLKLSASIHFLLSWKSLQFSHLCLQPCSSSAVQRFTLKLVMIMLSFIVNKFLMNGLSCVKCIHMYYFCRNTLGRLIKDLLSLIFSLTEILFVGQKHFFVVSCITSPLLSLSCSFHRFPWGPEFLDAIEFIF